MWVRISDVTAGSPARRTLQYRNTESGVFNGNGILPLPASVNWSGSTYQITVCGEVLFSGFATAEAAKTYLDSILQPFYVDLP